MPPARPSACLDRVRGLWAVCLDALPPEPLRTRYRPFHRQKKGPNNAGPCRIAVRLLGGGRVARHRESLGRFHPP